MTQPHQIRTAPARAILLVPVDFSGCSRSALVHACQLVEGTRMQLLLLHVIHDDPGKPGLYRDPASPRSLRPFMDIATGMLEDMLTELRDREPGLQALQALQTSDQLLIRGLPGPRIIEIAEREQVAMIIMGTHGRDGFTRLLQGSVAEYVAKHARVPVMTVKDDDAIPVPLNLDCLDNAGVPG